MANGAERAKFGRCDRGDSVAAAANLSRRSLLTVGGLVGFQLLLPDLFRAQAMRSASAARRPASGGSFGRAKSVIMLYLHGGHPQHETWDPKRTAPAEVRGPFGEIDTSVPGVRISELLPHSAAITDRLTIVRSLTHGNANHVQASLPAMTGHSHPESVKSRGDFPPSANDFPPFGAVLDQLRPAQGSLPTWVRVGPIMRRSNGTWLHGQLPGFLGARHSPFVVDQELMADDVEIQAVATLPDVPLLRLEARRDLLRELNDSRRELDRSAAATMDQYYERAFNLLGSAQTAQAFDLSAESPQASERYGPTEFGRRCLLARRLAEAEVPMVNVHYCHTPSDSWDTHSDNFNKMQKSLAPTFDRAFTALVSDLDERGLLDQTLVIATAEFGRTPQVNAKSGRDHWPWVYSIALAGAGVKPGMVYGASDNQGAYPAADPRSPADFAATVYHLLGIPADTELHDMIGRPQRLVIGKKIDGILT